MFGLSNVKKNWCKTNPPVLNIPSTEKLLEVSGSNTSGGSGPCNHLTVNEAARLHRSSTSSDLHPISETSISVRNRKPETGSRLDLWNFLTSAKLTSVSAPSTPLIETHIDSSELLHPNLTTTATVVKSSRFMRKSSSAMMNSEGGLKDLTHPAHSEILKAHSAVTIKLVKTGWSLALSHSTTYLPFLFLKIFHFILSHPVISTEMINQRWQLIK